MGIFTKKKRDDYKANIIVSENNMFGSAGGYTRLRDNVLYLNSDEMHKIIQIESSLSHECKTTVCANLAVSLGLVDKKILVIDLDFRRPKLHRMFRLHKENGIADFLLDNITKQEMIKKTEYKNVDVITRGGEVYNPSLILVSEKFKNTIAELRKEYDFILMDCPPILQVSDFIHISKVSDGVLFLAVYGQTTKAQVKEAANELKKNDIKILGSVFTMYDKKKSVDNNSYYRYYYEDKE